MNVDFIDGIYGMATGFVVAFLLTIAYQLTTGRMLGFALGNLGGSPFAIISILFRLVAGPAILAQQALIKSARGDAAWGAIGLPAACLWSLLLGTLLTQSLTQFTGY
jgi:hypothetical protein